MADTKKNAVCYIKAYKLTYVYLYATARACKYVCESVGMCECEFVSEKIDMRCKSNETNRNEIKNAMQTSCIQKRIHAYTYTYINIYVYTSTCHSTMHMNALNWSL